jgi:hypothetical protein
MTTLPNAPCLYVALADYRSPIDRERSTGEWNNIFIGHDYAEVMTELWKARQLWKEHHEKATLEDLKTRFKLGKFELVNTAEE